MRFEAEEPAERIPSKREIGYVRVFSAFYGQSWIASDASKRNVVPRL